MDARNNDFDFDFTPIGQAIKKARTAKGMTRDELSRIVDYDPSTVLEFESENKKQEEWLIIFQDLFKTLRPDILYYENNPVLQSARNKVFEKYGITGVMKERGEKASTTEIIKKMKS